jgi:hypothetical protein
MRPEGLVLIHVVFGMLGILAGLWLYVEALNCSPGNQGRIRVSAILAAVFIWLSYLLGGYYYVLYYAASKKVILGGPFPWAHNFFMETKEHVFFMLLLLATYLPIAVYTQNLLANKASRNLVLAVSGLIVILGLIMDGSGAMIIMGEKVGLQVRW